MIKLLAINALLNLVAAAGTTSDTYSVVSDANIEGDAIVANIVETINESGSVASSEVLHQSAKKDKYIKMRYELVIDEETVVLLNFVDTDYDGDLDKFSSTTVMGDSLVPNYLGSEVVGVDNLYAILMESHSDDENDMTESFRRTVTKGDFTMTATDINRFVIVKDE